MAEVMLDQEAADQLIAIGATVERWILRHASAGAAARAKEGGRATITTQDIEESLAAFKTLGVNELAVAADPPRLRAG